MQIAINVLGISGAVLIAQLIYMMFFRQSQGDGDIGLGALSLLGGGLGVVLVLAATALKILF